MATWSREVFARNLRFYMERSGKMQKDLAEIAGVSGATFNDWLKAKKYPRIDKIDRLADYFGILKSDLIEDKNIKDRPVQTAERHVEMIMDEDINSIWDDFRFLSASERKIVRELAHNLRKTKTEA